MSRNTTLWGSRQNSGSKTFSVVERRWCCRMPPKRLIIPLYITILQLCLCVVNSEIPEYPGAFLESSPILPEGRYHPKPSPRLSHHIKPIQHVLRRRDVAGQSTSTVPGTENATDHVKKRIGALSSVDSNEQKDGTINIPTTKSSVIDNQMTKAEIDKLNVSLVDDATIVKIPARSEDGEQDAGKDELGIGPSSGLKPDAILRLFYVCAFIGVIVLIYILIKFLRFRKKRSTKKYRVLAHSDEQEMFPLAADDGDDEEIFSATDHHQTLK